MQATWSLATTLSILIALINCGQLANDSASPPDIAESLGSAGSETPLSTDELVRLELDGTQIEGGMLPYVLTDSRGDMLILDRGERTLSRWRSDGHRKWHRTAYDLPDGGSWLFEHIALDNDSVVVLSGRSPDTDRGRVAAHRQYRLDYLDGSGRSVRQSLFAEPDGEVTEIASTGHQLMMVISGAGFADSSDIWQSSRVVVRLREDGSTDTIITLPGTPRRRLEIGLFTVFQAAPFAPRTLLAFDNGGEFYIASGGEYVINRFNERGGSIGKISRPVASVPVTDSLKNAFFRDLQAQASPKVADDLVRAAKAMFHPATVPPIGRLAAGGGLLAIERSDFHPVKDYWKDSVRVDLLDMSGRHGYVILPPATTVRHLTARVVYAIQLERLDSTSLLPATDRRVRRTVIAFNVSAK